MSLLLAQRRYWRMTISKSFGSQRSLHLNYSTLLLMKATASVCGGMTFVQNMDSLGSCDGWYCRMFHSMSSQQQCPVLSSVMYRQNYRWGLKRLLSYVAQMTGQTSTSLSRRWSTLQRVCLILSIFSSSMGRHSHCHLWSSSIKGPNQRN